MGLNGDSNVIFAIDNNDFYSNDANIEDANQKQDEESSSTPPPSLSEDCPGVKVEFHVVIHDEWKFDPVEEDKSVYIRFGVDELGCWKWNCVHMESAAKLDEHLGICEVFIHFKLSLSLSDSFSGILEQQSFQD